MQVLALFADWHVPAYKWAIPAARSPHSSSLQCQTADYLVSINELSCKQQCDNLIICQRRISYYEVYFRVQGKVIGNSSYLLTEKVEQLKKQQTNQTRFAWQTYFWRHTSFLCSCIRILATQGGLHLKKKIHRFTCLKVLSNGTLTRCAFFSFFNMETKQNLDVAFYAHVSSTGVHKSSYGIQLLKVTLKI